MKRIRFSVAALFLISVVVPHAYPVEISKDTVLVNDINFTSCLPSNTGKDTLALWNTVNSPIAVDSIDLMITPLHDGLFRMTNCNHMYSDSNAPERIQFALCNYENESSWIRSPFFYRSNNQYRVNTSDLSDTAFVSLFNFDGSDTSLIYGILIADCFICASRERFLIDFSARMTLHYSDGSPVSFYLINRYQAGVKFRPENCLHGKKNIPRKNMFNIKGQMFHSSAGNNPPGIYVRSTGNYHNGSEMLLYLKPLFDGQSANAP